MCIRDRVQRNRRPAQGAGQSHLRYHWSQGGLQVHADLQLRNRLLQRHQGRHPAFHGEILLCMFSPFRVVTYSLYRHRIASQFWSINLTKMCLRTCVIVTIRRLARRLSPALYRVEMCIRDRYQPWRCPYRSRSQEKALSRQDCGGQSWQTGADGHQLR